MKSMINLSILLAGLVCIAGCDSSSSTPADAGVDLGMTDQAVGLDGVVDDGTKADSAAGDAKVVDAKAKLDSAPKDATLKPDVKVNPGALTAKIVKASAWANLMPIVAPDPTRASVEIELKNTSGSDVTGIKVQNAELQSLASPPASHPLTMVTTMSSFTGVIKAGQTKTVGFAHQTSTNKVPVPFKCGSQIKMLLEVVYDGGKIGPLEQNPVSFQCTY